MYVNFVHIAPAAFTKYVSWPVHGQLPNLAFKKLTISQLGFSSRNIAASCVILCQKYDACKSFYVEDGACVFGLSDDVRVFLNGDDVTPANDRNLTTKGSVNNQL